MQISATEMSSVRNSCKEAPVPAATSKLMTLERGDMAVKCNKVMRIHIHLLHCNRRVFQNWQKV